MLFPQGHLPAEIDKEAERNWLARIERAVKLAGGAGGLVTVIYKVVKFIVEHWDIYLRAPEDEFEQDSGYRTAKLVKSRFEQMMAETPSQKELKQSPVFFEKWFTTLPDNVRIGTIRHFTESKLIRLAKRSSIKANIGE
ncbi:MAG TPA: hypothetical protein VJ875_03180 [Pyrinomonadaceae bacterium]|nr:hypothetical protein [Pyrinomonadaceae bacterium]